MSLTFRSRHTSFFEIDIDSIYASNSIIKSPQNSNVELKRTFSHHLVIIIAKETIHTIRMKALSLLLIAAFGLSGSLAVDRNNFKTCEQSGFCKRLRGFKPEKSQYALNVDSVFVHGNVLSAEVFTVDHDDDKKNILWRYALRLSALADGTFRVEMDEAEPLYPRYRTQIALEGEPKGDGLKLISNENGKLTLSNTQGHKVVITIEPLKIEFVDHTGEVAVVLNENSQLVVEPLRVRREKIGDDDEQGNIVEVSIPEHTDNFYLKTTTSGEPYRLYNLDVFEYELDSPMAIYGAVPVLYSHSSKRSSGVFWHNSAETWVDVVNFSESTVVSSLVNFMTGGQKQRVDASLLLTHNQQSKRSICFQKFSLAYHQSRWNYMDEVDLRTVDEGFDEHDIPADALWLDIEYTDKKKYFTWDAEKFRHPTEMVSNLTAKGRKLVVIIDPHIKREAGYFVHEDCTAKDYYVKNKEGRDYEGWCWPGSSSYPDFFNPEVTQYYIERYKFENFPGTSKDVHIWNDMNEPSVFNGPEITMPKDCRHWKPRNKEDSGLASYWEHSYAAVWTGDNAAEWGFLQASVPMCISLATAGISFCGSDVGGFFKYPEAELMTRWYQAGAYQAFFRAHSHIETKRREPWLYDATTISRIRDAVRRRYALLDFWYTLFYEHSIDGLPVTRPLFQEFPKEEATFTIDNQYLLGDKLLIRPVLEEGVTSVKVYLPGKESGTLWYDVDSYHAVAANGWINLDVTITKIPVYQRGGTIVPRKERVRRASSLMANDPYTLVVALDSNNTAHGTVYIDDGETFDYKSNKYIYGSFDYQPAAIAYKFINKDANYPTRSWVERIVIAGIKNAPKAAKLVQGGKQTPLQMTLHRGNDVLVVRKPGASMAKPWEILFTY
ncbi:jg8129 [Pararge aegeria aegeria]|uniref:Glucosidase II subunit alpha n=1 Tax=Pararge aegeria aegeria TaxID=348720 RepID=A0A8S4RW46_9NEOP|nr:jg8129 [Pararge aegeria aegeria]